MDPTNVKIGDLFLAKLAGYPLWPVRILEVMKTNIRDNRIVVFHYGKKNTKKHDRQILSVASLLVLMAMRRKHQQRKLGVLIMRLMS